MKAVKILDVVTMMNYLEGGKSQISRADMIEIVGLMGEVMLKDGRVIASVIENGRKRDAKRNAKRKK